MPEKKKKKKKKESKKAAALRRQREEEERKRKEEEELRRQQEEEERKRREEEERIRREKERIRLERERERIEAEAEAFQGQEAEHKIRLREQWSEVQEEEEWEQYLKCEHLPNVDDVPDVNAFLSIWKESESHLDCAFQQLQDGLSLFRKFREALGRAKSRRKTHKIEYYHNIMVQIYECCTDALDKMTAWIMIHSQDLLTTADSRLGRSMEAMTFDLWINLTKNPRLKQVEHPYTKTTNELTMKMSLMQIAVRVMRFKDDILTTTIGHRTKYYPIGGILYIELLSIPPPSKEVGKNWTLRPITELSTKVQRQYNAKSDKFSGSNDAQPMTITFQVDDETIIHSEDPSVGWWDSELLQWSTEGVSDIEFDFNTRILSFATTQFTTAFALVQRYDSVLPFKEWYLTPTGRKKAILSISTMLPGKLSNFKIKIFNDKCKLVEPNIPKLSHILNKYMPPRTVLTALANSGINLVVEDKDVQDNEYLQPKNQDVEEKMYQEMAFVSTVCHFASSKWNQAGGRHKAIFRVSNEPIDPLLRPGVDYERPQDDDDADVESHLDNLRFHALDQWFVVSYEASRCGFMALSENDIEFKDEMESEDATHLNLFVAYQEKNPVILTHVNSGDVLVTDTVKLLLEAIRPLSWS